MTEFARPSLSTLQSRIEGDLPSVPGVLRTPLAVALSRGHHSTNGFIAWADKQSSPLTCEEERLNDWAALYKVPRLLARASSGPAKAVGTSGSPVLKDTEARGPNGLDYAVSTAAVLGVDGVLVQLRCLTTGEAGNLAAGQTLTFIDPPPGVSASLVVAADGITGGAEQETVDSWRVRVSDEWQTVVVDGARGGKPNDYRFWARSAHPSVSTALVQLHALGLGTVIVRPICNDLAGRLPTAAILEAVEEYLAGVAPAGADWSVTAPLQRAVAVELDLAAGSDTDANRNAITAAVAAVVLSKTTEGAVLQPSEIDAAVATVTSQYTRLAPMANIVAGPGELLVMTPIGWAS